MNIRDGKTKKRHRLKYKPLIYILVITAILLFIGYHVVGWHQKNVCRLKIAVLRKSMIPYQSDNQGKLPPSDKWCDVMLEFGVTERYFQCPGADKGQCHYAINPYAEPNSPPNTVLLFETKSGWNKFGGPEILTTDHHRGKGCNVAFVDAPARFINKSDLPNLKWKADPNQ